MTTVETRNLIQRLKDNDQDFEWYPTTDEMIYAVMQNLPTDADSILDIGAGNGKVLEKFATRCERATLYGIEISPILVQEQPGNIIPVGTDLFEQNLSCLPVDYIFCNPIYSQFEEWTCKIIEEGYAKKAFLVIPQRWKESKLIAKALKFRDADARIIYSGDFLNAERAARAVIDIVEIRYPRTDRGYRDEVKDPFDIWFDQNIDTFDKSEEFKESETREDLARKYQHASIAEMVEAYLEEYKLLEANYRAIFTLDLAILKELGVDKEAVREGLKKKMAGLKVKYWQILFERLDAITSRLTTKSRKKLLDKLTGNTSVEFTASNAYAVVLWAIKNANQYFDEQTIALFYELATFEGHLNYKSNQKTWEKDGWRYNSKKETHYALDYRIVVSRYHAIAGRDSYTWSYKGNLHDDCHDLIADIKAVLSNLGFSTYSLSSYNRKWKSGQWQDWYNDNRDGGDILFQAKAFMNGNVHLRFTPEAIKALNIRVAILLKWIRTEGEVVTELGYTAQDAKKYYHASPYILPGNIPLLQG